MFASDDEHIVVKFNNSGIKLLIPDGFINLSIDEIGDPRIDNAEEKTVFTKEGSNCNSAAFFFTTSADEAMSFDNKEILIDGIHESLSDQQGLICVESGTTPRGYDYIYSIVKTLKGEFGGVQYFLRMNIRYESQIVEIQSVFDECGMTGVRESVAMHLSSRAGLIEFGKFDGWCEDPYDPSYSRGIRMNLAERAGLDGMFPENPLSQTREFIQAVLYDELIIEEEKTSESERKVENDSVEGVDKKEILMELFDKSEECRRPRRKIQIL